MKKKDKVCFELADIVQRFLPGLPVSKLSPVQYKALHNIRYCRTAVMGGHEEECDHCHRNRYSYNSCRDRHCPKCQNSRQAIWVDELIRSTLPVKHYHIIFTVPHHLNGIALWNGRLYYNLLFECVWQVLRSFGYSHYGVETGAVALLHSWGQNLSFHPHIHCIVPAAGYTLDGRWKNIGVYQDYLYPVPQLSDAFKHRFLDGIKRKLRKLNALSGFHANIQKSYGTNWVVYCESSLAGSEHVIRYLGQYTHRIAISNQRILNVSDTHVRFIAKDYRDRAQKKPVELEGTEFLRRFCQHTLPHRFVRIRRYGIYNSTTIRNLALQFEPVTIEVVEKKSKNVKKESTVEKIHRLTGFDIGKCPFCNTGRMQIKNVIPRIRSPGALYRTRLLS